MAEFSGHPTAEEIASGADLRGKLAVVTGAASGIGEETARVLAGCGAEVVVVARSEQKAEDAIARIRAQQADARLEALVMDLEQLDSVRDAAAKLLQRHPRIDLLINNAGIMACPLGRTAQGCELQFGTNHIGHFLFTCLLEPALKAGKARVVNLSSGGHKYSPIRFEDPHFEQGAYDKWLAYGQSKTANILFSVALSNRLGGYGVYANAVHPGAILTNLGRHLSDEDMKQFSEQMDSGMQFKTPPHGAATSVWAALAPELEGRGGLYLEDCHIGEPDREDSPLEGYKDYAVDPVAAEKLWALSEEIVGQRFRF